MSFYGEPTPLGDDPKRLTFAPNPRGSWNEQLNASIDAMALRESSMAAYTRRRYALNEAAQRLGQRQLLPPNPRFSPDPVQLGWVEIGATLLRQDWEKRRAEDPAFADESFDDFIARRGIEIAQEATAREAEVRPGLGPSLLAGFAVTAGDPENVAASFIPLGVSKTILGAAVRGAALNAGVEAGIQPIVAQNYRSIGEPFGLEDAARNVAIAAAFGGTLDAAIKGAPRVYDALRGLGGRRPPPAGEPPPGPTPPPDEPPRSGMPPETVVDATFEDLDGIRRLDAPETGPVPDPARASPTAPERSDQPDIEPGALDAYDGLPQDAEGLERIIAALEANGADDLAVTARRAAVDDVILGQTAARAAPEDAARALDEIQEGDGRFVAPEPPATATPAPEAQALADSDAPIDELVEAQRAGVDVAAALGPTLAAREVRGLAKLSDEAIASLRQRVTPYAYLVGERYADRPDAHVRMLEALRTAGRMNENAARALLDDVFAAEFEVSPGSMASPEAVAALPVLAREEPLPGMTEPEDEIPVPVTASGKPIRRDPEPDVSSAAIAPIIAGLGPETPAIAAARAQIPQPRPPIGAARPLRVLDERMSEAATAMKTAFLEMSTTLTGPPPAVSAAITLRLRNIEEKVANPAVPARALERALEGLRDALDQSLTKAQRSALTERGFFKAIDDIERAIELPAPPEDAPKFARGAKPVKIQVKREPGFLADNVTFTSSKGFIRARARHDDKHLQMDGAFVNDDAQGAGHGVALYLRAVEFAHNEGRFLASDRGTTTDDAAKIYAALARRGYHVLRSKEVMRLGEARAGSPVLFAVFPQGSKATWADVTASLYGRGEPADADLGQIVPPMSRAEMDALSPEEREALFARSVGPTPLTGLTIDEALIALRDAFGADTQRLMAMGRMQVVRTVDHLPDAIRIHARPTDRAVAHRGVMYVVADNVRPEELRGLVAHELGIHIGLPAMMGQKAHADFLRAVEAASETDPDFAKARALVERRYPDIRGDHFFEEVAAHVAEAAAASGKRHTLIDRLIGAVRDWLRKIFPKMALTADDVLRAAIGALRRMSRERVAEAVDPAFARGEPAAPDAPPAYREDALAERFKDCP